MTSRRKNIITEIQTALSEITTTNGYYTDAGNYVYLDISEIDENSTFPAININESMDTNSANFHSTWLSLALPVSIEGYNTCLPSTANEKGHELIADIKKAIFSHTKDDPANFEKITYQGADIAQRENGTGLVAVNVNITIHYKENLNDPDS